MFNLHSIQDVGVLAYHQAQAAQCLAVDTNATFACTRFFYGCPSRMGNDNVVFGSASNRGILYINLIQLCIMQGYVRPIHSGAENMYDPTTSNFIPRVAL